MIVTHKLSLDLQHRTMQPRLAVVQCDHNTRAIEINMISGGQPWTPDSIDTVFLRYRKCDGTGGSYDALPDGTTAWAAEENKITILLAPQVLTVPGLVEAQALLISGNRSIATFTFQIVVEADPSIGVVTSEDYLNWSVWAKDELANLLQQAKDSGDFTGSCFVPTVDSEGILSWTNDAGLENPDPVNIADLVAEKLDHDVSLGDITGHLTMNGYRIMNLADPVADSDAATRGYVHNQFKKAISRNLLDNSNFTNPVNQRGKTSYSGAVYGIDRWKGANSSSAITLESNGIKLTANGTWQMIYQLFPLGTFSGKTITFAVCDSDGIIYAGNAKFPTSGETATPINHAESGVNLTFDARNGIEAFRIGLSNVASSDKTFVWAAAYEGEYTAETLPEYRPKGYAAELLECMRYYQIRSANNISALDMRPLMRLSNPTITNITNGYAYSADL